MPYSDFERNVFSFLFCRWVTEDTERSNRLTKTSAGRSCGVFLSGSLPLLLFLTLMVSVKECWPNAMLFPLQTTKNIFHKNDIFFAYPDLKSTHFNFWFNEWSATVSFYVMIKKLSENCGHLSPLQKPSNAVTFQAYPIWRGGPYTKWEFLRNNDNILDLKSDSQLNISLYCKRMMVKVRRDSENREEILKTWKVCWKETEKEIQRVKSV